MKQMTEIPGKGTDRDARTLAVLEAHAGRGVAGRVMVQPGVEMPIHFTPYMMWHDLGMPAYLNWATTKPDSDTTQLWVWSDEDSDVTVGVEEDDLATDSREGWSAQAAPIDNVNEPKLVVWRPAAH